MKTRLLRKSTSLGQASVATGYLGASGGEAEWEERERGRERREGPHRQDDPDPSLDLDVEGKERGRGEIGGEGADVTVGKCCARSPHQDCL